VKNVKTWVGADWSVVPKRRAAWAADLEQGHIFPCQESLNDFESLLSWAETLPQPSTIMIDAGLGITHELAVANDWTSRCSGFADVLRQGLLDFAFLDPVSRLQEWTPHHPFIHLPAGQGSFSTLKKKAEGTLFRSFEPALGAKPIFILSGIPGCVGGASRNLWISLQGLFKSRDMSLWPFDGDFEQCLQKNNIVICEAYPKLAFQIASAEHFPIPLKASRKRDERWRRNQIAHFINTPFWLNTDLYLRDLEQACDCEDSFDALMLVLSALRMRELPQHDVFSPWEGHILGRELIS
jgi:hypothetical protein